MRILLGLLVVCGLLYSIPSSAQAVEPAPNLMETFERIDRLSELLGNEMLEMLMDMLVQGQRDLDKILDELERNAMPPKVEPEDPDSFEI